jgi:hypothetical protein
VAILPATGARQLDRNADRNNRHWTLHDLLESAG